MIRNRDGSIDGAAPRVPASLDMAGVINTESPIEQEIANSLAELVGFLPEGTVLALRQKPLDAAWLAKAREAMGVTSKPAP